MNTREKNASGAASMSACASPRRRRTLERPSRLSAGERRDDAVEKRLAADDADIGIGFRLLNEMFAGAEPDFEPDLARRRSAKARAPRPALRRDREQRQRFGEQTLLARAKRLAAAASIEGASGAGPSRSPFASHRTRLSAPIRRGAQRIREIGLLPGEAAVGFRRAAEMTKGRRSGEDRTVQFQMLANSARGQVHDIHQRRLELAPRRCAPSHAGWRRSTAAAPPRWRRKAGACSDRRGRPRRRSWPDSAPHRPPSGRPWSGPCRRRRRRRAAPRRRRCRR